MPRLPPRKQRDSSSPDAAGGAAAAGTPGKDSSKDSSSSGSKGPQPRPPLMRLGQRGGGRRLPLPPGLEPPEPPSVLQEKALAGLLAYTGMMGSLAVAISFFTPGLDLFGDIHWDAADVGLGLQLMLPVYLMNVAILAPNYSTWKIPEMTPESQQKMADTLQQWRDQKTASSSTSSGAAAPAAADAAAPAAAAADGTPAAPLQHDSSSSSSSAAPQPAAAAPSASANSSSSQPVRDQAPGWLGQALQSGPGSRLRDALFLAQGHYLSLNQALLLPPAAQAGLLLAECLAAELLYRSVALQLAGGWLSDRLYEGGGEDLLGLVSSGLPVLPTHSTAGQLLAVGLLSGGWALTVARRVQRLSRRPGLALAAQGRQQAGRMINQTMAQAAAQQQQHRQRQDGAPGSQQQIAQPPSVEDGSSSSAAPAVASDVPASSSNNSSSSSDLVQQRQQQPSPSREASDLALAAAAREQQQPQQARPPQHQWARRSMPGTMSALALSTVLQGARDLSQMTALGLSFALTGNLAAPLAAALINQALLSVLQNYGVKRARERSMAIAKQLAALARSMRDIQRKKEAERQQQQQQQQAEAPAAQQTLAAAAAGSTDGVGAAAAAGSAAGGAAAAAAGGRPDAGANVADAAAVAAAATAAGCVASAAAGDCDGVDASAAGTPAAQVLSSRMEATIDALDQLLGPAVGEHATASK